MLASLGGPSAITSAQADNIKACLIQTIETEQWALIGSPAPSPDPAGITLLPNGHFLMPDSEVEEAPAYNFHGINLYEADRLGILLATGSTLAFSREPTGVAINPSNGHLFFSDDDQHRIFEVNLGLDGRYGTGDDTLTSFSTEALNPLGGRFDPEGVALGLGDMFLVSAGPAGGEGQTDVYQIDPGQNGRFDGLPSVGGDDVVVNHFLTNTYNPGVPDPEGIAFNPDHNSLYIIGRDRELIETTPNGTLLNTIDITPADVCYPSDVVQAPGSLNPLKTHLYIPDRGVDNGVDPYENDGKVYEVSLDPSECALLPQNLLLNPGFELGCNSITYPARWSYSKGTSTTRNFTRSNALVHGGRYAGKHSATDNSGYNVYQDITGLSAGTTYHFSGWVNIPPSTFTNASFGLEVKWIKSDGTSSLQSIKTYTAATSDWEKVVADLVAPTRTVSARVRMVVSNLNATIYVDGFVLSTSEAPLITGFTPASDQIGGTVTITGSRFRGATAVTLNGVAATFTVDSDTQIRATVPTGATTGPISVTTVVGTEISAGAFTVTNPVTVPPTITSFIPSSGPVGTEVTITGSHFAGTTDVTINGTSAITFTVDSDTQVRAIVQDGTTSTGLISVTTPAGTGASSDLFTVTVPPMITLFTPTIGLVGSEVIITGSHFTGATDVTFNGFTPATSFIVDSDTQIRAIVPKVSAGASTSGYIAVTSPMGTGVSTDRFTVVANAGLLANSGFELDTDNDTMPDSWTLNPHFTRSDEVVAHGGSFVGRHSATDGSSYTVSQTVGSLTAGKTYNFSGRVNIPSIGGSFRLDLKVVWLNSTQNNKILNTTTIKSYTAATNGWVQATANLTAPNGADSAQVQMILTGLKRTLYVDDFVFSLVEAPTISSFTPSSGKRGTAVTISGSHFTGVSRVTFNGKAAGFVVDSDTQIQATVPNKANTGPISVTNVAGTATGAGNFTVIK